MLHQTHLRELIGTFQSSRPYAVPPTRSPFWRECWLICLVNTPANNKSRLAPNKRRVPADSSPRCPSGRWRVLHARQVAAQRSVTATPRPAAGPNCVFFCTRRQSGAPMPGGSEPEPPAQRSSLGSNKPPAKKLTISLKKGTPSPTAARGRAAPRVPQRARA